MNNSAVVHRLVISGLFVVIVGVILWMWDTGRLPQAAKEESPRSNAVLQGDDKWAREMHAAPPVPTYLSDQPQVRAHEEKDQSAVRTAGPQNASQQNNGNLTTFLQAVQPSPATNQGRIPQVSIIEAPAWNVLRHLRANIGISVNFESPENENVVLNITMSDVSTDDLLNRIGETLPNHTVRKTGSSWTIMRKDSPLLHSTGNYVIRTANSAAATAEIARQASAHLGNRARIATVEKSVSALAIPDREFNFSGAGNVYDVLTELQKAGGFDWQIDWRGDTAWLSLVSSAKRDIPPKSLQVVGTH